MREYRGYYVDTALFNLAIAKKGLTLSKLAESACVHRSTISNIRRGYRPSTSVIGKLTEALGLTGDECEHIFFATDLRAT